MTRERNDAINPLLLFICLQIIFTSLVTHAETPASTVRIGVLASLSGNWAPLGEMTLKGIRLAEQTICHDSGIRVQLSIQDTHESDNAAGVLSAFQILKAQGITLLIGPTGTPGGMALAPVISKQPEITIVSPSVGTKVFHESSVHAFNTQGMYTQSTKGLAEHAYRSGFRRMAIFSSSQPWDEEQATTFRQRFLQLGGTINREVAPIPEDNDLRAETIDLLQTKPEGIFLSNYSQVGIVARRLREYGYKGNLFAALLDSSRLPDARGALENTIFGQLGGYSDEFKHKFRNAYTMEASFPAGYAFDALSALCTALADSSSKLSLPSKLTTLCFPGSSGNTCFKGERSVERPAEYFVVRGSEFISIP